MARSYIAGTIYEKKFVAQYGGELVTNKEDQNRDIDVLLANGKTVSVKNQTKGSGKSGNISLELRQFNTATGKEMAGNFEKCEADLLAIAVTYEGEELWLLLETKDFKDWVNKWKEVDWKKRSLLPFK
jgi:hypothetical protein